MKASAARLCIPLALLLAACGDEIEPGRTPAAETTVRGLTLATVAVEAVPAGDTFVGTVESSDRAVLAARIDGRVERIAVREGETVRTGELLLTIDQHTAGTRLAEAEGKRKGAAARLALAEQENTRYRRLFAAEAVTAQEMDRIAAELEQARQGYAAAQAATEAARIATGYTRVVAPYAGRLVRREVEEGTTVQPGTPLLILDRAGEWRVRARLPEAQLGRIAPGDLVTVVIPALGRTLSGRVDEVLPATDPQSRSFEIKVALADGAGLSAGLFARVATAAGATSAILVPAGALVERGQLTGLYTVEDRILRYRLVRTGRRVGDRVEILAGLAEGSTIVAAGTEKAQDGARVEP